MKIGVTLLFVFTASFVGLTIAGDSVQGNSSLAMGNGSMEINETLANETSENATVLNETLANETSKNETLAGEASDSANPFENAKGRQPKRR